MAYEAPYFMYFPDSYRWSSAFVNLLGTAPYGGADISEVHKIGLSLSGTGARDDESWFAACVKGADLVKARAEAFEASGYRHSAALLYLRACHYYQMGERFRTPKDEVALEIYRTSLACFEKFRTLKIGYIERVEVPYLDSSLPAYFVPAQNTTVERPPCVVYFGGLDITKEIQYCRGVDDLTKRGISVLVVDGPGTGEAIRFRGILLRPDYDKAGSACLDYLETRSDVDPSRIGIVAISLGGYYAPRCASMDHRFAACIAWGAIWDYHRVWKRRIDADFRASMSVPGHHIMWVLGVETREAALEKLLPYKLDGIVQHMRCPFLVVHGEDDEQVPLADARALFEAVGSRDKTIRIFTREEGGAQHCQRDYLPFGIATMWNWFEDKLLNAGRSQISSEDSHEKHVGRA